MSNRTVPATAEGLRNLPFIDLESAIFDAQKFVELAELTANSALADPLPDASDFISIYDHDRNMILFAVAQAAKAAERAYAAYQVFVEAAR